PSAGLFVAAPLRLDPDLRRSASDMRVDPRAPCRPGAHGRPQTGPGVTVLGAALDGLRQRLGGFEVVVTDARGAPRVRSAEGEGSAPGREGRVALESGVRTVLDEYRTVVRSGGSSPAF